MIYLDNASTTAILPEVFDAMLPYLKTQYGNPGTLYELGRNAKKAIETAREQVAGLIGAAPEQIIFTSGGTESNNTVFRSLPSLVQSAGYNMGKHIVTAYNEHDSVLKSVENICIKHGFCASYLRPDPVSGCIVPANVQSSIIKDDNESDDESLWTHHNTGLVSIMYVNNETGAENDVAEISEICQRNGILFHTDCVQALGSVPVDVGRIKCDFASFSSHKIHGPKGVGALFVGTRQLVDPLILGGSAQEGGIRGGTENVAGIVGFGKACELTKKRFRDDEIKLSMLKQVFYTNLEQNLEQMHLDHIVKPNVDTVVKHGKILNLRFDGIDGETLVLLLDRVGIMVSAGAACSSNESKPSHVLLSMGISPEDARNSVRFSFSVMNTEEEMIRAADLVAHCVGRLKQL